MTRVSKLVFCLLLCLAATSFNHGEFGFAERRESRNWDYSLTAAEERAVNNISAASLRGHLSFIASDALGGRPTPSKGQQVAAEYIAAQFRRVGLEAAGDSGYFQTCRLSALVPDPDGFVFRVHGGGREVEVSQTRFEMDGIAPVKIDGMPLVKVDTDEGITIPEAVTSGKAVIASIPSRSSPVARKERSVPDFPRRLLSQGARFVILLDRNNSESTAYFDRAELDTPGPWRERGGSHKSDVAIVNDPELIEAFDAMPLGNSGATLTLHLAAPKPGTISILNVAGLLRGSDSELRDSYVVVSAHYDGTGTRPGALGDRIWNAANDDGSGTVSVIEIAAALAGLEPRPRRSILFLSFSGEELGSLGARCYVNHPLIPMQKTIADLNLEQVGRSDSPEGDMTNRVSVTGDDYSDVGAIIRRAAMFSGITVQKPKRGSDPYFERSDNLPFAEAGVPAHTICVALEYPDYHGAGDEWEKIDYENMARTDRMIAGAVLTLAQNTAVPAWNRANPVVQRFIDRARGRVSAAP